MAQILIFIYALIIVLSLFFVETSILYHFSYHFQIL